MVDFWEIELRNAIKITKHRIEVMETHGKGNNAMREKSNLDRQKKMLKDRIL